MTYKYGLSPKLAVSSSVHVINFGFTARMCAIWRSDLEVQTDLENDVITSVTARARSETDVLTDRM